MIERHYSAKQVMEALSVSKGKAYEIMYQMPHLEGPLRVSEQALKTWIEKNTVYPMPARRRAS